MIGHLSQRHWVSLYISCRSIVQLHFPGYASVYVRIEQSRKKYVDCLTYKNIVWPLSSYENQSNVKSKIISVENKYRVKKSGSLQTVMIGIIT